MGHYSIFEGYKDTISNKYKKLMVSSYIGHPILHAYYMHNVHIVWDVLYKN